jgi:hypothetical protein
MRSRTSEWSGTVVDKDRAKVPCIKWTIRLWDGRLKKNGDWTADSGWRYALSPLNPSGRPLWIASPRSSSSYDHQEDAEAVSLLMAAGNPDLIGHIEVISLDVFEDYKEPPHPESPLWKKRRLRAEKINRKESRRRS